MEHPIAIRASESARAAFIRRTYAHLAGAILAFASLEFIIFGLIPQENIAAAMQSLFGSPVSLLILFGAFIAVGWLAQSWAMSDTGPGLQYAGLALYVLFEALIFVPILYVAKYVVDNDPTIIPTAGILTLAIFGALTMIVFTTRKDFSYLGPILSVISFLVMGLIICAILFQGIHLGMWFSFGMVAVASAYILYYTSNVLHHFRTDQHVAAALALFAAVALLFYYILRILIALASERR
jgi:FtsH-binding integral membrane protein